MTKSFYTLLLAVATLCLGACGGDDVTEEIRPEDRPQDKPETSIDLKGTKWMGVFDAEEYVEIAVAHPNGDYTWVDSLVLAHDTVYYDFGAEVSYPTYTKLVYNKATNFRHNTIAMCFDYRVEGDSVSVAFRSYPLDDPGTRQLVIIDAQHLTSTERGQQVALQRLK